MHIGTIETDDVHNPEKRFAAPITFGDRVKEPVLDKQNNIVTPGDLLAVVWSKDLGEKKSELVDAICQFRLDQETLTRLQKYRDVIPDGPCASRNPRWRRPKQGVHDGADATPVAAERKEIDDVKQEAEATVKQARESFKSDKPDEKVPPLRPTSRTGSRNGAG